MHIASFFIILIVGCLSCFGQKDDAPKVKTRLGTVVGNSRMSETGKMIYSFEGIPYIKPPVGQLRFKAPQPAEPWAAELHSTTEPILCTQKLVGPVVGVEDCVYLNVHTVWNPSTSLPDAPMAVMVYIHGGGFVCGSGCTDFVGLSDYLLEHNVVLVTVSYRLGVLGFLSTEDEEAPGNYGLLDQVEALKWVRDNIAAFGGNPEQVTIFGESAGSASVHMLMLSPHAKGLFHRAIGQSGVAICPWAITRDSRRPAQELARKVGCHQFSSSEMLDCLRTVDAETLVDADIIEKSMVHGNLSFVWVPRVDVESSAPYLPKHPVHLMANGEYNKVPLLIGHVSNEGGCFLGYPKQLNGPTVPEMKDKWDNACKILMGFRDNFIPEDKGTELCSEVKQHYIDGSKSFEDSVMDYATIISDVMFSSSIYKAAQLMSAHSDVYSYVFSYDSGTFSFMDLFFGSSPKIKGNVAHADDLLYLFKFPQTKWTKESPEYETVKMMTKIWTDFAKTGVPSIPKSTKSWPKATWPNHKYVVLDTESSIEENYRTKDMEFLQKIFSDTIYKSVFKSKDEL